MAALAVAPGAAMAGEDPDAALLALCRRHAVLLARIEAMDAGAPHTDADMDAASNARADVGDEIAALCPSTPAGILAKARATQACIAYFEGDNPWRNGGERMMDSLLTDLIARGGAA